MEEIDTPYAVFYPERYLFFSLGRTPTDELFVDKPPEGMETLTPDAFPFVLSIGWEDYVSGDTPFVNLMAQESPLLRNHQLAVVVDGYQAVGVIVKESFESSIARSALFMMIAKLEDVAIAVCRRDPVAAFHSLSEHRRKKASDLLIEQLKKRGEKSQLATHAHATRRFARGQTSNLPETAMSLALGTTTFADKGTILRKSKLTNGRSASEFTKVWDRIERLRNYCCHPDEFAELPYDLPELAAVLRSVEDLHAFLTENSKSG